MAAAIEAGRPPGAEHVAQLSAGGTRTPWFCVVARHEMTLGLRRELPGAMPERPAYSLALLPPGFAPPAPLDVGALAAVALEQLLAVAPTGPYLLGGYSLGGAVAWEMACRLRADGREVALVAILDTRAPHRQRGWGEVAARRRALRRRGPLGRARGYAGMIRSPARRVAGAVRTRVVPRTWTLASEVTDADVAALVVAYRPPAYAGSVLVFHTDEAAFETGSAALGWQRHARGPLATRRVGGVHAGMISAAHAAAFAAALRDALDATGR
jgi:thioesterase domain-containing protein